jgi:diguanylate cyclase (GGDEF)-like protein
MKTLVKVLERSEQIKELVKLSARELWCVNEAIGQELANRDPLPGIKDLFKKSRAVECKVQEAAEMLAALNRALEGEIRARDMVDLQLAAAKEQEEAARDIAFHDALTGLPNRALFNDRLEHGIAQASRHGLALAVMFVDLDKFKSINDAHGHDAGDAVLQTVAQRLRDNTRDVDTVSRLGGDEFLCLLTDIHEEEDIAAIAAKIVKALQAPCRVSVRSLDIEPSIEASIGISIFPKDGATPDALIRTADAAMYRAKQSKSGYSFAAQEPSAPHVRQRTDT